MVELEADYTAEALDWRFDQAMEGYISYLGAVAVVQNPDLADLLPEITVAEQPRAILKDANRGMYDGLVTVIQFANPHPSDQLKRCSLSSTQDFLEIWPSLAAIRDRTFVEHETALDLISPSIRRYRPQAMLDPQVYKYLRKSRTDKLSAKHFLGQKTPHHPMFNDLIDVVMTQL